MRAFHRVRSESDDEVFGFYQGSPIYPIQREYYKPSYIFGLRYTLSNEPNK